MIRTGARPLRVRGAANNLQRREVVGAQPDRMRITIYGIRREGPYVVLDFGAKCSQPSNPGCDTEEDFTPPAQQNKANDLNTPAGRDRPGRRRQSRRAEAAPFDRPPSSPDTSGLKLGVLDLISTVGNPTGSDQESSSQATLTLQSDVLFRFDKATLTPRPHAILDRVAP